MPLIGHALVGWATALESRPEASGREGGTGALFVPVVVAAAYLPDAVAQAGLLAGWADAPRAGHSLLLALAAIPLLAAAVSAAGAFSYARGLVVAGVTLGLHDALDLLQSTDRQPLWPFSDRPFALDRPLLPESALGEAAVFGACFLLYLAVSRRWRRPRAVVRGPLGRLGWAGRIATGALVLLAVATHGLRGMRERQLSAARAAIEHGDVQAGLRALDDAERWPSTARAGRVDYLRGEAHAARGERALAEAHYLRSRRADPAYFWSLADLALFYARGPEPADERARRVVPLLDRLRAEHPRHGALPRVLAQAERALARPAGDLDKAGPVGRN
ncbi:MAG: metal-dependent hydrolase [Vicinamibacteria bacterium]